MSAYSLSLVSFRESEYIINNSARVTIAAGNRSAAILSNPKTSAEAAVSHVGNGGFS